MTSLPTNIRQALQDTVRLGLDRLDAQMLLLHALNRPTGDRAWLIAHDQDLIEPGSLTTYRHLCRRRLEGEPVAYLIGSREFFNMTLQVDKRVLVPRPDTEILVEWALELLAPLTNPTLLDLGTGSGAIALAIKNVRPDAQVVAVDASQGALEVARSNGDRLGLAVTWIHSNWMDQVPGRFDLIVSNPPYIADDDHHLKALQHEPRTALVSGPEGLSDLRHIVAKASAHLQPAGALLLEHGHDQASAVRALLGASGYRGTTSKHDLAGIERCSGGWRPTLG